MTAPAVAFWLADLRGDGRDDGAEPRQALGSRRHAGDLPPQASLSPEEHSLVAGIRAGDARTFEQLYQHYWDRLYAYAMSQTRNRDLAAEVVQDVFLAVWRRRDTFTITGTLASYLYVAVRNRAVNTRRVAARDVALRTEESANEWTAHESVDVAADVARADLVTRIWAEVEQLPPTRREALTLRWRHGLAPEEIATVQGTTVSAAKMQVSRALQTLRERLRDLVD